MKTLQIKSRDQYFEALLPAPGYRNLPFRLFILSGICFLYGLAASIITFNETLNLIGTPIPYLLALFTLVAFIGLFFCVVIMFSEVQITLSPAEFSLSRVFYGIERIYTTDLNRISAICLEDVSSRIFRSSIQFIAIYDVDRKHVVGAWLKPEERNLLMAKLLESFALLQSATLPSNSAD